MTGKVKQRAVDTPVDCGGGKKHRCKTRKEFTCMHLADVLTAAVSGTLKAMVLHVQTLKEKHSTAFKDVKLRKNGIKYRKEDIPKIAKSIAECKLDGATNAEELLSWLTVSAA